MRAGPMGSTANAETSDAEMFRKAASGASPLCALCSANVRNVRTLRRFVRSATASWSAPVLWRFRKQRLARRRCTTRRHSESGAAAPHSKTLSRSVGQLPVYPCTLHPVTCIWSPLVATLPRGGRRHRSRRDGQDRKAIPGGRKELFGCSWCRRTPARSSRSRASALK